MKINGASTKDNLGKKKELESMSLTDRFIYERKAYSGLIVKAWDDIADANFRALVQKDQIIGLLNNPFSMWHHYPGNDLLSSYSAFKNTLSEMVEKIEKVERDSSLNQIIKDKLDGFKIEHFFLKETKKNFDSDGENIKTVQELCCFLYEKGLNKIIDLLGEVLYGHYYPKSKIKRVFSDGNNYNPEQVMLKLDNTKFTDSPVWLIPKEIIQYIKEKNNVKRKNALNNKLINHIDGLITPRSFSSKIKLTFESFREVDGYLDVIYDIKQGIFNTRFLCINYNSGNFSKYLMKSLEKTFSSDGYKFDGNGSTHHHFIIKKESDPNLINQDLVSILNKLKENVSKVN